LDPQTQFCHNSNCPVRGIAGQGHIRVLSQMEHRYLCKRCKQSFSATTATPFFGLRTAMELVTLVLTLLTHGCPLQAIVAAFGFDERTVADWQNRAGSHAQGVHEHLVQQHAVDLQHVQADEIWVKMLGRKVWMAMAMAVPSRLWLGGEVSATRDLPLITRLIERVKASALHLGIVICVDGLSSYVTAVRRAFRLPQRTGKPGRPKLLAVAGLALGQVIKRRVGKKLVSVQQRVVLGTEAALNVVLWRTGTGSGINTAYIERLNATFRGALAPLRRRGRALLELPARLSAQMWLVGGAYNFCWEHKSLRAVGLVGAGLGVVERTPAMAAGLTDHCWTLGEFLQYQVPLPPWEPPKRRGRPPKRLAEGSTCTV
jgi:transposase-like protein